VRSLLYALARLLGDVSALWRGHLHKRFVNKLVGRKLVSRMWWR
jgi:hypothetical protein